MKKGKEQFVSQYQPKENEFKFCAQIKALKTFVANDTASKVTYAIKKEDIEKLPDALKINLNIFVSDQLVKEEQKPKPVSKVNPTEKQPVAITPDKLKHLHYSELEMIETGGKFDQKNHNLYDICFGQEFVV